MHLARFFRVLLTSSLYEQGMMINAGEYKPKSCNQIRASGDVIDTVKVAM